MDEKLSEWRDYKGLVELQVKGDGSEVRAIKTWSKAPQYYNYKIQKDTFGRRFITVTHHGKSKRLYVDGLVATCFCHPQFEDRYIGHKDGDIANDSYDNLECVDWDTYLYMFHRNKTKLFNGEIFAWWIKNLYISEKGYMLIENKLYDADDIQTNISDPDLDMLRVVPAYILYNGKRIFIEDVVKAIWNKVILHIDGDFNNWQETNLKIVDADSPEAEDNDTAWKNWRKQENRRLYKDLFPNRPYPSFLE